MLEYSQRPPEVSCGMLLLENKPVQEWHSPEQKFAGKQPSTAGIILQLYYGYIYVKYRYRKQLSRLNASLERIFYNLLNLYALNKKGQVL
jgi:hypothetical protein